MPYSDEQWSAIEALGHRVDEDPVRTHDVRLTQGGELTFVPVDDRDGAEWNTEALGPTSACSAGTAGEAAPEVRRWRPAALRQGKWYPGEQLLRWSLNLFWRKDREPVWTHPGLFADEHKDYGVTDARRRSASSRRGAAPRARPEVRVFPAHEGSSW